MAMMTDYHRCPLCYSGIDQVGEFDVCRSCNWKERVPSIPESLMMAAPGTVLEGQHGVYERTEEGDWLELETGIIFSDGELAAQEREHLS